MELSWKHYHTLLVTYLAEQWGKVAVLGVLLLASIGLQLLNPQILRGFIDAARDGSALSALVRLAWYFLAVGLLTQGCTAFIAYLGADVGWVATNRLRASLALHCLRLDMPFHHKRTPGEMIERVDGDVNALATFFSSFIVNVLGNSLLLVGVLIMLFREDWRVGLALSGLAVVSTVALVLMRHFSVPILKAEREIVATMFGFVEERLGGIEDIRGNGMGAYTMRCFARIVRKLYGIVLRAWMIRNVTWFITTTLFMFGNIAALVMGVLLFRSGAITLGTVYLLFQYNVMLRNPLEQLTRQMQDLQQAGAGMLRINEVMAEQPQILDGPGAVLPSGAPSVAFDRVTFAYGEGEPVLHDINFRLEAGRVLGVLGRTGSGKTTLTRLLFRLYDIQHGDIQLGGVPIKHLTLAELRRQIGMVTQEVQLFHASVRDNLTFFDRSISDTFILQMIEELGLQEWLARLPEGLNTMLQAGGAGLSAGESQLLAFTRVFLQNPGLVLLDEPSSRLDPATERLIERAVDRLLRERTCIIIAHRLGTVQRADEILVLEDGRVLEHGPRQALADDPTSRFAHLLKAGLEKELA